MDITSFFNSWIAEVECLPKYKQDLLLAELKRTKERIHAENKGFYQPLISSGKPTPPGAK